MPDLQLVYGPLPSGQRVLGEVVLAWLNDGAVQWWHVPGRVVEARKRRRQRMGRRVSGGRVREVTIWT